MPIILIIIGVIAALGLGGYFWETSKDETVATPTPVVTTVTTETPPSPELATVPTTTPTTAPLINTTGTASATAPVTVTTGTASANDNTYKDGTYTATVSYIAPDRASHPVTVKLTLTNDIVTDSTVTYAADVSGATADFENRFAAAYKSIVVGQSLSSIHLSRVAGASLTTNAWNQAQAQITTEAKA